MCGICGIVSGKLDPHERARAVRLMNKTQERRGPDGEGIYEQGAATFGHRRLAIIDLSSGGHQPMVRGRLHGQGEIAITFNGEIYNYKELRSDLVSRGHSFRTESDTEVILALFDEYGTESFVRLRGMFGFALWDGASGKCYLVRDHLGVKPLYYSADGGLVFASSVRALKNSGVISAAADSGSAIRFLLWGSIPEPFTSLANVRELPAGHFLSYEISSGRHTIGRFYDLLGAFLKKRASSFASAAQTTRRVLEDSVEHHLISDAPLGIFLSGGVDSSAIALLAAMHRTVPLTTLSVDFEETTFSEKKYQDEVVRKIGSEHRRIVLRKKDFEQRIGEVFEAMDQPTVDGVNTFFISAAAKEAGLKAVLSGVGGDELFFGYSSFRHISALRQLSTLGPFAAPLLHAVGSAHSALARTEWLDSGSWGGLYAGIRGLFSAQQTAKLLDATLKEVQEVGLEMIDGGPWSDFRMGILGSEDALSYSELTAYMRNQLLKDADSMSMFHSVEVRTPFVDRAVVECAAGFLPEIKRGSGDASRKKNKPLIVSALKGVLPVSVADRKKMSFAFPFADWLKGTVLKFPRAGNVVAREEIEKAFVAGHAHWSRLWALTVLARQFSQ